MYIHNIYIYTDITRAGAGVGVGMLRGRGAPSNEDKTVSWSIYEMDCGDLSTPIKTKSTMHNMLSFPELMFLKMIRDLFLDSLGCLGVSKEKIVVLGNREHVRKSRNHENEGARSLT